MSISIVGEVLSQASAVAAVTWNSKCKLINGYQQTKHGRELRLDLDYQLRSWGRKFKPLLSLALGELASSKLFNRDELIDLEIPSRVAEVNMFPHLHIKNNLSVKPDQLLANTSVPIPIDTDNFAGQAMLLLQDPKHEDFDESKPAFEVQIQGKFKEKPNGIVFIGAESHKEQVASGTVARAVTATLKEILATLSPLLHASTGNRKSVSSSSTKLNEQHEANAVTIPHKQHLDTTNELVEKPHMTYPLWVAADTFHVTKSGETPPSLGPNLKPETEEHYQDRIASKTFGEDVFNAENTITFAFNSVFLDFVHWRIAKLPPMSGIGLELFFGKDPIHVCMYEVPKDVANAQHFDGNKRYYLSFELGNALAAESRPWRE